jgi:hypothetical protein
MTFEKFLQESCGATYPLRDLLNNLTDEQIEEAVQEYKGLDFVRQCGCCEEETMHRVIYACNECEKYM